MDRTSKEMIAEIIESGDFSGRWEIVAENFGPESTEDADRVWMVGNRTLTRDGETVAQWSRCVVGYYHDHVWTTREDTTAGDIIPDAVAELLVLLDLEDELPEGPEEPVEEAQ